MGASHPNDDRMGYIAIKLHSQKSEVLRFSQAGFFVLRVLSMAKVSIATKVNLNPELLRITFRFALVVSGAHPVRANHPLVYCQGVSLLHS